MISAFLKLPYELVVPDVLLEDELLSFTQKELKLLRGGMTVATLESEGVERVAKLLRKCPYLSTNDGFAYVAAEDREGCIFLTGDRRLRALAEENSIEVHGVLWLAEELLQSRVVARKVLLQALREWRDDVTVRVPAAELGRLIAKLRPKK